MNLILLGAPGAGKGTQATKICEKYGIPHISTGDIFRKNISEKTPIGLTAKSYIDKGQLVPDEVTVEIVRSRLLEKDCENGYLLDGFPRTLSQAEALSKFTEIDAVVDIEVPLNKLMKRLTGRRVCPACKESFHIDFLNGSTVCSRCGATLVQRADDNEETVQSRLNVYTAQTEPLIDYYKNKGVLISVDGDNNVEKVFADIVEALK